MRVMVTSIPAFCSVSWMRCATFLVLPFLVQKSTIAFPSGMVFSLSGINERR